MREFTTVLSGGRVVQAEGRAQANALSKEGNQQVPETPGSQCGRNSEQGEKVEEKIREETEILITYFKIKTKRNLDLECSSPTHLTWITLTQASALYSNITSSRKPSLTTLFPVCVSFFVVHRLSEGSVSFLHNSYLLLKLYPGYCNI